MLRLKNILKDFGIRQRLLAERLGVSDALVSELMNHGKWPKSLPREKLEPKIRDFLKEKAVPDDVAVRAFEELSPGELEQQLLDAMTSKTKAPSGSSRKGPGATTQNSPDEDEPMLLRKHTLTPAAKRQFGIFGDPFSEVTRATDVFLTPESRYVREVMWHAAQHGGFVAIWGESGAGKTTLKKEFFERIARENPQIVVIQPYVVGTEDNNVKGSPIRAVHIADAIIEAIDPLHKKPRNPQAKFSLVHKLLKSSADAGYSHVIMIEEAHSLDKQVLKQFKRFLEMEDGFKKLLSVILIGQTELAIKLDERDASVREVVQRCELVQLTPLGEYLRPYLEHRFKLANKKLDDVMDETAVDALRAKLTFSPRRPGEIARSILYPLAVGNVLTASMNAAAEYGAPKVTADIIRSV